MCSAFDYDTENMNSEDIYSSLKGVTEAIQNFSVRSQEDMNEPVQRREGEEVGRADRGMLHVGFHVYTSVYKNWYLQTGLEYFIWYDIYLLRLTDISRAKPKHLLDDFVEHSSYNLWLSSKSTNCQVNISSFTKRVLLANTVTRKE